LVQTGKSREVPQLVKLISSQFTMIETGVASRRRKDDCETLPFSLDYGSVFSSSSVREEDRKKTEGRHDETFSSLVLVLTLQSQGYKYKQFFYQQHPNRK
jgi:uncharacterized membrane protein